MNRSQGPSSLKRKKPDSQTAPDSLTEQERILYNAIKGKQGMGIWTRDLKRETNLPDNVVNKWLKSLKAKSLIKEVVNIKNKGRKHYMAAEFEPSNEITGGAWYANGNLDMEYINVLKRQCLVLISRSKNKVAMPEGIFDELRKSGVFTVELTSQQVEEILRALVLDNEIMEVKSSGMGEFVSIPVGKACYKCIGKGNASKGEPRMMAMASIPCGVCPRISDCTPDGIISPKTCIYFTKWLDF